MMRRTLQPTLTKLSRGIKVGLSSYRPSALFANGEQGAWYDPSDLLTLFQDAAGTTPVTAMEQPVGLMLDKSKGLVRGPELWDDNTVTLTGGTSRVAPGVYRIFSADGTLSYAGMTGITTAGKVYEVTFNIDSVTVPGTGIGPEGTSVPTFTTTGPKRAIIVAINTNLIIKRVGVACDYQISNVSFRELLGNHATQSTATSRPVVSARVNLLNNSGLTGGGNAPTSWTYGGSGVSAPEGGIDGNIIYHQTAIGERPYLTLAASFPLGTSGSVALSAYVEQVYSGSVAAIQFLAFTSMPAGSSVTYFINGTPASGNAFISTGDRVTAVLTSGGTAGNPWPRVGLGVSSAITADISFSRPQLEIGNIATRYQRVNTATDYDATGFPVYLKFDGVDDSLSTGNIDFTSTDKMTVWAGARKLSDAAAGLVAGIGVSGTNGTMELLVPQAATTRFGGINARATLSAFADLPSGDVAPVSAIVSAGVNFAAAVGAQLWVRKNSGVPVFSNTDAGTGAFSNTPLYIGRRAGSSLPFNGNLYGLIVRGAATTDVTPTERYLANKTGVTLP